MRLYLYLGRRDRKGLKLLSTFSSSQKINPTRVSNIDSLNLPSDLTNQIKQSVEDNKMMYEAWIETSSSFQELKNSLKARGYKNLPLSQSPIHMMAPKQIGEEKGTSVPIKGQRTMLRRGSNQDRRT